VRNPITNVIFDAVDNKGYGVAQGAFIPSLSEGDFPPIKLKGD
jgi:hypothetical protein